MLSKMMNWIGFRFILEFSLAGAANILVGELTGMILQRAVSLGVPMILIPIGAISGAILYYDCELRKKALI